MCESDCLVPQFGFLHNADRDFDGYHVPSWRTFKKNDNGRLIYSPDSRTYLGDLDEDTLDVFFVRNYYKELGYENIL